MSKNRSPIRFIMLGVAVIAFSSWLITAETRWSGKVPGFVQELLGITSASATVANVPDGVPPGAPNTDDAIASPNLSNGKIVFHRGLVPPQTMFIVDPAVPGGETSLGPGAYPVWRPDGGAILFTAPDTGELKLMNPDGSNIRSLATAAFASANVENAAWLSDGTKIAFVKGGDLWIMNADGSGQTRLTNATHEDMSPTWSPDGTKIAFQRGNFAAQIYTVTTANPSETNLTNRPNTNNRAPNWSPEGSRIAFESDRDTGFFQRPDIYVYSTSVGSTQRITNDNYDDHDPAFSPDGTEIVWQSGSRPETTSNKLFVMQSSGNPTPSPKLITAGTTMDLSPNWGPGGNPIVELIGLEVTQAVQDLRNSVPLVADKRTVIRAHVRTPPGSEDVRISAFLVGTNSAGAQNDRLAPRNRGNILTAFTDPERSTSGDSFYFELPANWTRAGTLQFRIESPNAAFVCHEPDGVADCTTAVTFHPTKPFSIKFILMTYTDSAGIKHTPDGASLFKAINENLGGYPISGFDGDVVQTATARFNPCLGMDALTSIRKQLNNMRNFACKAGPCKDYYQALVTGAASCNPPTTIAGMGDLPGHASVTFIDTEPQDDTTRLHEQGHALGFRHTNYTGTEKCGLYLDGTFMIIPCTQLEGDGTLSLSKDQYQPNTAFGCDVYRFSPTRIYSASTPDFMSYGSTSWLSRMNYINLFDNFKLNSANFSDAMRPANIISAAQTVVIDGTVSFSNGTAAIGSVFVSNTPGDVMLSSSGAYELRFENGVGTILASYPFDPIIGSEDVNSGIISLQLPWDSSTRRIVVLRNGQVLSSRQASANSPTVLVTSPNGGETLTGNTAIFTWTVGDADGDPLTYVVEYSKDNGANWIALASDWDATSLTIDLTMLPSSTQALLRVTASDGFNTTTDQSNAVFTVPPHAPLLDISTENNSVYVGDQTIILNGMGLDIDDGILAASRLSWTSSLNGLLGTGSSLAVNATTLLEGTHTITLTGTDSTNRTGTASISIKVFRNRPTFPAALSAGPADLAFTAYFNSGLTAPLTLAIRNSGDGDLAWSATADQPWIQLVLASGAAPSNADVKVSPTGLALGNYSGKITITAPGSANSPQTVNVSLRVIAAPLVSVAGRVLTPDGRGLRNAVVVLTDSQGARRTATTSSFGVYSFDNVRSGETYFLSVSSKRYRFASRSLPVNDNLTNVDFVGLE